MIMKNSKKIRKGDTVEMKTGKDRGKRGRVIAVHPKDNRITVEGLNLVKKHKKPKRAGQKGEIVLLPQPVNISNAMLVCPKCANAARIGIKRDNLAGRVRVCKKCNNQF